MVLGIVHTRSHGGVLRSALKGLLHIGDILELYWDNGKENANYRSYRGYVGTIGFAHALTGLLEAFRWFVQLSRFVETVS